MEAASAGLGGDDAADFQVLGGNEVPVNFRKEIERGVRLIGFWRFSALTSIMKRIIPAEFSD